MGADINALVNIGVDAYAGFVGLTLLAVENKGLGLLIAAEAVCHGFEGLGSVKLGEHLLYFFPAVEPVCRKMGGVDDIIGLLGLHTLEYDIIYLDLLLVDVDSVNAVL